MELRVTSRPEDELNTLIDLGLDRHGKDYVAETAPETPLNVYCHDAGGLFVGGLRGNTGNGWLHIWQLWVAPQFRRQGVGAQILAQAEAEARARGCDKAHLETFPFQGAGFYEALGYRQFAALEDYLDAHALLFLRKAL